MNMTRKLLIGFLIWSMTLTMFGATVSLIYDSVTGTILSRKELIFPSNATFNAQVSIYSQTNSILNVGILNLTNSLIVNGSGVLSQLAVGATNASGGTNILELLYNGVKLGRFGTNGIWYGNFAGATNLPISAFWGSGGTNTANTNGTLGQALFSSGNGGVYFGASQTPGVLFGDRAVWNGTAWEDDSRWTHFENEFFLAQSVGYPMAVFGTGTGAGVSSVDTTSNRLGVVTLSPGTTANGYYGECIGSAAIRAFTWGQGEKMITDLTCYVDTLSDDTENYCFQFGYSDSQTTNNPADTLLVQYSNNTNAGKWEIMSRNSTGSTNVYDIGTNVVARRWYDIRLVTDTDGTSSAYLDGVLVKSGIPATSGQVIPMFRVNKAAGLLDRPIRLDYYRWSIKRATTKYQ